MKVAKIGSNYIIRLEKGELLFESVMQFCREYTVSAAWFWAIGGVSWVELGFYNMHTKEYYWKLSKTPLELTGLTGNVARMDDELIVHMHGNFSDEKMRGYGGHVKEAEINGTCEIRLQPLPDGALRRFSETQTGLNVLDL